VIKILQGFFEMFFAWTIIVVIGAVVVGVLMLLGH
jgi:hypothetical protein